MQGVLSDVIEEGYTREKYDKNARRGAIGQDTRSVARQMGGLYDKGCAEENDSGQDGGQCDV